LWASSGEARLIEFEHCKILPTSPTIALATVGFLIAGFVGRGPINEFEHCKILPASPTIALAKVGFSFVGFAGAAR
jgi:hypothetical protein